MSTFFFEMAGGDPLPLKAVFLNSTHPDVSGEVIRPGAARQGGNPVAERALTASAVCGRSSVWVPGREPGQR